MLVVLKQGSSSGDVRRVLELLETLDLRGEAFPFDDRVALRIDGAGRPVDRSVVEALPGVERIVPLSNPLRLAAREHRADDSIIRVGGVSIGGPGLTLVAGPCAVETEDRLMEVARRVKAAGAGLLRGGAYKPRTSPYSFQGLGEPRLEMLARAGNELGMPVVSEAMDEASMDLVERYADVVQIGARNMQNFALLRRAGRGSLPVFLKRGMSARLEDLLMAAEYVLNEGNPNVILCERGIRTFADHCRYTLDLSIVPAVKAISHLPIFVDPSHATGVREFVGPMARAAVAAGASGVMLEVHTAPHEARCDGRQALLPDEFAALAAELNSLAAHGARRTEPVT